MRAYLQASPIAHIFAVVGNSRSSSDVRSVPSPAAKPTKVF
jgi:hypothetical protein